MQDQKSGSVLVGGLNAVSVSAVPASPPGRESLRGLAHAHYFSCALHATVKLGLADRLATGPESVDTLASEKNVNPEMLRRLLRFLASIDVFAEDAEGRFSLTNTGAFLRVDHPRSLAREIAMFAGGEIFQSWGALSYSLETGRPAFEKIYGKPLYEYFRDHPETAGRFHASWQEITSAVAREAAEVFDTKGTSLVVDVGCGSGIFAAELLRRHASLRGIFYDLPSSLVGTTETVAKFGVAERATIVSGDARTDVPTGGDVYFLKSVVHGCDDDETVRILSNCRKVLPPNGRVVVVERVIPDGPDYHWSRLVDMTMMVITGGKERTKSDYESLYARSGLVLSSCVALPSGFSLVEGVLDEGSNN
jgi:ubiquinone/menaquinone biosynthesis C-methylase UbiE